jgi:hypothetical protein
VLRVEISPDGAAEMCDITDQRWLGAATPAEMRSLQATLAGPAWQALDPGPAELPESRFELFQATGKQVVRPEDAAAREPALKGLLETIGAISRLAKPLSRPTPPATWPRCRGT